MKRFRRWLFNGLAAVSLLLGAATIVLWVQSHFTTEPWFYTIGFPGSQNYFFSGVDFRGVELGVDLKEQDPPAPVPQSQYWGSLHSWGYLGFRLYSQQINTGGIMNQVNGDWIAPNDLHKENSVQIARPILILLLAILPAFWLKRRLGKTSASATGLCARCGYDLRATPQRCPECGTVPAKALGGSV